jgi:hypothetical protein
MYVCDVCKSVALVPCEWQVPLSQITDKEQSITTARVFSAVLQRQLLRQRLATCSLNAGVLINSVV